MGTLRSNLQVRILGAIMLALAVAWGAMPSVALAEPAGTKTGDAVPAEEGDPEPEEDCSEGHDWDDGAVTKEPGCLSVGVRTYTCRRCGETRTEEIAALGHSWDGGAVTQEATCTASGVRTYTCTRCGETYTESLPALGHSWDGGKVTKKATCTASGVKTYTCTRCGETRTEGISALGHDWDGGKVTKQPTCTAAGTRTYTCKHDSSHTKTESIAAKGHSLKQVAKVAATCQKEGTKAYWKCSTCGKLFSDKDGKTEISKPVAIKKADHKKGEVKKENVVKPTCTKAGSHVEVTYCKTCKKEMERKKVTDKALGHNFGDWEVTKEPTTTEEGVATRVCKRDSSHVETRPVPKLSVTTHTVTYDLNGGNFDGSTLRVVETYEEGKRAELLGAPKREGCVFAGWTEQGSPVTAGFDVNENHVFVAQWDRADVVAAQEAAAQAEPSDTDETGLGGLMGYVPYAVGGVVLAALLGGYVVNRASREE